jgi:hypothetical protein
MKKRVERIRTRLNSRQRRRAAVSLKPAGAAPAELLAGFELDSFMAQLYEIWRSKRRSSYQETEH